MNKFVFVLSLVFCSTYTEYSINDGKLVSVNDNQNDDSNHNKGPDDEKNKNNQNIDNISIDLQHEKSNDIQHENDVVSETINTLDSAGLKSPITTQNITPIKLLTSPLIKNDEILFSTKASEAILIDAETKTILYTKNAYKKFFPSSMTKMMTLYILFSSIRDGKCSLDSLFEVSHYAHKAPGSKMFLATGEKVTVNELINGIAIVSGNDASITVAENLVGSEEAFADFMMYEAERLGMNSTQFKNCTGLPNQEHFSSAYDIALLAVNLWYHFPEFQKRYSQTKFSHNEISQPTFNTLLFKKIGVDGIKTGHTDAGGYGVAVTAVDPYNKNKRYFLVINGCKSVKERTEEATRLLAFATRNFDNYKLFEKNQIVGYAKVVNGSQKFLPLYTKNAINISLEKSSFKKIKKSIIYTGPVIPPVQKDSNIGILRISVDGKFIDYPLFASDSVRKVNIFKRIFNNLKYILFGEY